MMMTLLTTFSSLYGEWEWAEVRPMREPRMEHMSAVVNGEIYVFGGRRTDERQREIVHLTTAEKYDPVEDEWSSIRSMPYPVSLSDAVAVGDLIYIFGGVTSQRMQPVDSILVYDTRRNSYQVAGQMPEAKHSFEAIYFPRRGQFLIAGGLGHSLDDYFRGTSWYDLREEEWSDGPDLPQPMAKFGLAAGADSLWITGGLSFGGPLNRCSVITPRGWSERAELPIQCGDPSSVFLGDTLINAGGTGRGQGRGMFLDDVFGLTVGSDEWRRLPAMNYSRTSFELVALGDSVVYAIGGLNHHHQREWGILNSVEKYYTIEANAVPEDDRTAPRYKVSITSNPSHGFVQFNLPSMDSRIRIFDLHGRQIVNQFSSGGVWSWNSVGYPTGTYIYAVTPVADMSSVTGRIHVVK